METKGECCRGLLGYEFIYRVGWRVMPLTGTYRTYRNLQEEGKGSQEIVKREGQEIHGG